MKLLTKLCALFIVLLIFSSSCTVDCDCYSDPRLNMVTEYDLKKSIIQINSVNFATGFESYFSNSALKSTNSFDSTYHAHLCQYVINPVRFFDDKSGYFFVESNTAWMVAHALKPELIGTYRYNTEDITGKLYVQEMVEAVTYKGYGFIDYYFAHPETQIPTKKLAFVKEIPFADFFIGTGFYEYDDNMKYTKDSAFLSIVENVTKSMAEGLSGGKELMTDSIDYVMFCRDFIDNIRFFDNQSGYFFIYDFDCVNVAHGTQKDLQGENLYNYQDSQGNFVIRELVDIARNSGNGYFEYYWNNPVNDNEEPKKAYVYKLPGIDYLIGSGVYLD
jgi:signal transduction histidine kinase